MWVRRSNRTLSRAITGELPPLFAVIYARASNEKKGRKVLGRVQDHDRP